jgi:hypothetical protein
MACNQDLLKSCVGQTLQHSSTFMSSSDMKECHSKMPGASWFLSDIGDPL